MSPESKRRIARACHQAGFTILGWYWSRQAQEDEEMGPNKMRLCDAGIREQEWAQKLIDDDKLPPGIMYQDLLAHGIYDASADEIHITIKGVCMKFKVERP